MTIEHETDALVRIARKHRPRPCDEGNWPEATAAIEREMESRFDKIVIPPLKLQNQEMSISANRLPARWTVSHASRAIDWFLTMYLELTHEHTHLLMDLQSAEPATRIARRGRIVTHVVVPNRCFAITASASPSSKPPTIIVDCSPLPVWNIRRGELTDEMRDWLVRTGRMMISKVSSALGCLIADDVRSNRPRFF